jgi:transposase
VSKIALYTGCQWAALPIGRDTNNPTQPEISWDAVYYPYRQWSRDRCLERVWSYSILTIQGDLDWSVLSLYGSQGLAKTSNSLPVIDHKGYVLATTDIVAGHHAASDLKPHLRSAFKAIKRPGLSIASAFFNADSAFNTQAARQVCLAHRIAPNIAENKPNQKYPERGRKRLFNLAVSKDRFAGERTVAWIDQFRALLVQFDLKNLDFLGSHFLAFTLIKLRNVLA